MQGSVVSNKRIQLAKVWPLYPDIPGLTAHGQPQTLQPGVAGYMELDAANKAQSAGQVQLMAGNSPSALREPRYRRADIKAVPAQEVPPVVNAEPVSEDASPAQVPKRRGRPRKDRTYLRNDMKSED